MRKDPPARVAGRPHRRRRTAAAKGGRAGPAHVDEAMRAGRKGKAQSPTTRAGRSAAHRQRGTRPPKAGRPWTEAEDALLRTMPPAEVVRRTGRTLSAVCSRRDKLGLTEGHRG